jgi:hypothetical protein
MKLVRRHKRRPAAPPLPRNDAIGDRGEQRLYDEAFAEAHWRRPTPFF